jgi:hypothetical protein
LCTRDRRSLWDDQRTRFSVSFQLTAPLLVSLTPELPIGVDSGPYALAALTTIWRLRGLKDVGHLHGPGNPRKAAERQASGVLSMHL